MYSDNRQEKQVSRSTCFEKMRNRHKYHVQSVKREQADSSLDDTLNDILVSSGEPKQLTEPNCVVVFELSSTWCWPVV